VRKKTSFFIFIPLLIAIGLLSLPKQLNSQIQTKGGDMLATILSYCHIAKKESPQQADILKLHGWFNRQERERTEVLASQNSSYPFLVGKVIFRSVHSWSSSIWIDIGSNDNLGLAQPIVCKNSPVINGDSVIGVIDYVGKTSSLVRLITDSALTPAVRVARGGTEQARILHLLEELQYNISIFNLDPEEENCMREQLANLQNRLSKETVTQFLAKGELQGHGEPLYRAPGRLLKGVGFNYDWQDCHGPMRQLRPQNGESPILQTQDLLVTSGLDGVFPEGLPIARVHSIAPLKEGAIAYEILAEPTAYDLFDLQYVSVIAPQSSDLSNFK